MAGNVGPINPNTTGLVGGSYGFGSKPKSEQGEETQVEHAPVSAEQKQVSADKVLDFMAQSAVSVTPKTIDPSKYVDAQSEARIAAFMGQFEDIVAENLSAITAEFPGISEGSAMTLALSQVKA